MDRVTQVRKGSGATTTRTYRPEDGVITGITNGGIQNLTLGYDGLGNLTSRIDALASGGSETFTYDNLNRLRTSSKQGTTDYTSDGNGNIRNKPNVGGQRSTSDYTYDSVHPHAVATAFGYAMTYDSNGNMLTRADGSSAWTMKWTGFDKPRWMAKTASTLTATPVTATGSEFHYNANRSRVMQLEFTEVKNTGPTKYGRKRTYAMGSTLELNYVASMPDLSPTWTLDAVRIYVPGPDGVIGAREFRPASGGTEKALVYHYDHLGSITAITDFGASTIANDTSGNPGKFSEDAWGQRRNPFSWTGAPVTTGAEKSDDGKFDSLTPRGFTGHEMLDDLGLVHMNGRIYDPLLGRFLSADIVVQAPGNLQAYNRYSYVFNNPLSFTDPTGFLTAEEHQKKIKEEEANKRAAVAEHVKKHGDKSEKARHGIERRFDLKINEHKVAIRNIVEVAAKMTSLAGQKVDVANVTSMARSLDDDSDSFKEIDNKLTFYKFVPGSSAAEEYVKGNPGKALRNVGIESAITLGTMGLGKLAAVARSGGGSVAADVVEQTAIRATDAAEGGIKRIVIGENMERVRIAAKQLGAETFEGKGMQANREWMQNKVSQGYEVHDIGPDFLRRQQRVEQGLRPDSPFYNMERVESLSSDRYFKLFERMGKYEGGVPGLD